MLSDLDFFFEFFVRFGLVKGRGFSSGGFVAVGVWKKY